MSQKYICFKVDEDLFRRVHVRAAALGKPVSHYVGDLIDRDLHPELHRQPTEAQTDRMRDLAATTSESIQQLLAIMDGVL